ncbi:hypothetical protein FGG08_004958 [Glutinoglossum americanum]|uniref:Nucleoside phosphorylase domain-containing protein n=1 Tax=Glutinoglossum americanum TaxID=1670608 RepID=A0A9P8I4L5_9PEZI|nr:hypothetical protein FGG08_004958 [Glutinoglossum americanum]
MSPRRLTPQEYTVGWICALPKEMTVAIALLDEEHESLHLQDDDNSYALGRIGNHNVAIACLPLGQIGTTSAAIVATRMKSSFRSIRFSLMVGIGGGVPSERYDIRLGDVVVGMPDHEYGGVVQYDLGKTVEKDGLEGFERTGSLNAPPPVLLNALAMLVARGPLRANQLPRYLSEVKIRISQSKFAYQGEEHDQLFEAEYHHVNGTTCEQCNGKLVVRPPRNSQDPVVHYGTIASGNRVIKNGAVREKFRKKYGMLCFEMEAAGLVNNFPCIVIRGICDYADSHKNDRWQEYAAATAAAYAKDLLSIIPTEQAAKTLTVESM